MHQLHYFQVWMNSIWSCLEMYKGGHMHCHSKKRCFYFVRKYYDSLIYTLKICMYMYKNQGNVSFYIRVIIFYTLSIYAARPSQTFSYIDVFTTSRPLVFVIAICLVHHLARRYNRTPIEKLLKLLYEKWSRKITLFPYFFKGFSKENSGYWNGELVFEMVKIAGGRSPLRYSYWADKSC